MFCDNIVDQPSMPLTLPTTSERPAGPLALCSSLIAVSQFSKISSGFGGAR